MGSARVLYRLHLGLCVLALSSVVIIAAMTLRTLAFVPLSFDDLVETCRSALFSGFRLSAFLALTLGLLSAAVAWRGGRSLWRRLRASRRFTADLPVVSSLSSDPSVSVFHDPIPSAFCAGLLSPRVYVSDGAVDRLAEDELAAVVAHERHHAELRDPLRLMAAAVLADALFFLPAVGHIRDRYAAMAELAADEAVVAQPGGREALASAMLTFGETPHGSVVGVSNERVDHLVDGLPMRWRLRASLLAASVAALGLLYLAALVVAHTGRGSFEASGLIMQLCFVYLTGFAVLIAVGLRRATGAARTRLRQAG